MLRKKHNMIKLSCMASMIQSLLPPQYEAEC